MSSQKIYTWFTVAVLFCMSQNLNGQDQALILHQLNQSAGLGNTFNMHFTVDEEGFFWTSSRDGLKCYDGKKIVTYRPKLERNDLDPNITSMVFQDSRNHRWFTSNSALHCLFSHSDSVASWQFSSGGNSYHYAFHLERDSFLWMVADQKVYSIDVHAPIIGQQPLYAFDTFLAYAVEDEKGYVKQLINPTINTNSFEILNFLEKDSIRSDTIALGKDSWAKPTSIGMFWCVDNDTTFWIPSSLGLIRANKNTPAESWPVYKDPEWAEEDRYLQVVNWTERYLLLTSVKSKVLIFDKSTKEVILQDSLFYIDNRFQKLNPISRIYIDFDDNLWLSVNGEGFYYTNLKNPKFAYLLPTDHLKRPGKFVVNSIIEDIKGNIVFNESGGDLFSFQERQKKTIYKKVQLNCCPNIRSIFKDRDQGVWIITNTEVFFGKDNWSDIELKLTGLIRPIGMIQLTDSQFLVVDNHKMYQIEKKSAKKEQLNKTLITDVYLPANIFFDSLSQLVFLSQDDNRLRVFDAARQLKEKETLTSVGIVNGICSNGDGDFIWLASSTGLYLFDPARHSYHKVSVKSGLLDRSFVAVVEDSLGMVWLSSYSGIYRYNPLKDSLDHFTQSDGLISMEYGENLSLYARNGKIYFGGNKGISVINPHRFILNPNTPKIQLINSKINDKPAKRQLFKPEKTPVRLKHDQNSLLFEFAILEFSDPKNNSLRYYLVKNWRDTLIAGNSNPVLFDFLSPGNYQLLVKAANSDNIWTAHPQSYFFTILPPWYQTWWARLLAAVALAVFVFSIYRYRIHQIELREEYKRKELEFKQQAAEVETAVLRLQMNPHFIFNSMNSISSYILQKDIHTANDYLHRFSHLMRSILERSEQDYTDLDEEIELLTLYLETEAMRLGKQLNFQFTVDSQIDLDETLLPTMILQPFIENAIWHGISPKKEGGMIQIRFSQQEGQLLCEVEDNGVGRHFQKEQSTSLHHSKALSITQRRLDLLSAERSVKAHFEIIDLTDTQGQPCGTKIQLFLPLMD